MPMDRDTGRAPAPRPDPPAALRRPRFRLTTRGLMLVVIGVGVALWLARGCARFIEELGEPYSAQVTAAHTFSLGPGPTVAVDCFAGTIEVRGSRTGETTAQITRFTLGDTQSDAQEALGTIAVDLNHQGDTLRIAAREGLGVGYRRSAGITLYVPAGAHLDLRTGEGSISVGPDYRGATYAPEIVVARSIRARNDSLHHAGWGSSNVMIHAKGPVPAGSDRPDPIRLQLDGCGMIGIRAERATVDARSWHSTPPEGWTPKQYEENGALYAEQREGVITFEGTLAEGNSVFRASHQVELKLAGSPTARVDALAHEGPTRKSFISGNLVDGSVLPSAGQARWAGALGDGSGGMISIRVDDGSIVLDRKP